ncbi:hypothetical protein P8R33_04875 [Qipengyuania sp. XHP0211]|uniref:hypothetical protein n=1 Tax=Qipengyuania sp. XHP0211 TaxID=3038079 RepID=UPI00241E200A|nr:hypothetical protein [Qipengyuania sp. XHP0211]MDG5750432.1 hypothetical protein [Qipengyuania sp. XHP0211]
MKQIVSATALALILAACSSQEPAAEPEADIATATPTASDDDSAVEDISAGDADAAMDAMERDDATDGSTANASARSEVQAIPEAFRGTWATSPENCSARSFYRVTVQDDRVNFFEDGGFASDIRVKGHALAVTYPFENPNGETEHRVVYFARETEDRIRIREGDGESQTYVACPDQ